MLRKILAFLSAVSIMLSTAQAAGQNRIDLLQKLNVINGYTDNSMRLENPVTRAEFSKMAIAVSPYRDQVASNILVSPFVDVTHSHWAAPYIHLSVANKLLAGYKDAMFRPDNIVNYEETITVALRILGYTDDEFQSSWPYGQIGVAEKIGLTEGISAQVGQAMTRGDVADIIYNLLNTPSKGSVVDYIETLDYKVFEDVILIATANEDSSVGAGKIYTSVGTYRIDPSFNMSLTGQKGDMVTDGDRLVLFYPEDEGNIERYEVYSVVGNNIIVYQNGNMKGLDIDRGTTAYLGSRQSILRDVMGEIEIGYTISLLRNADGSVDYVTIDRASLEGPFTVKNTSWASTFDIDQNAVVIRDGVKSFEINTNDIIYYSRALKTVWAYSRKVTGIYESANPNKDTPQSITLSGTNYPIEGVAAYNALSSGGNLNYGDTITLLLGKNGEVADVLTSDNDYTNIVGYLIESGIKEFVNNLGNSYSSHYIKLVQTDGKTYEYTTASSYDIYKNQIVSVSFAQGKAVLNLTAKNSSVFGKYSHNTKTLGKYKVSPDIEILDISTTQSNEAGVCASVYSQRLDGVNLMTSNILYYEADASGVITRLVLNDVTGDIYSYGIITRAESIVQGMFASGSYTYDIAGAVSTIRTSGSSYSVHSGNPVKITISGGQVHGMTRLAEKRGTVSNISHSFITIDSTVYPLSNQVAAYLKTSTYDYMFTPIDDIIASPSTYNIVAYLDKDPLMGGKVRVIVVTK